MICLDKTAEYSTIMTQIAAIASTFVQVMKEALELVPDSSLAQALGQALSQVLRFVEESEATFSPYLAEALSTALVQVLYPSPTPPPDVISTPSADSVVKSLLTSLASEDKTILSPSLKFFENVDTFQDQVNTSAFNSDIKFLPSVDVQGKVTLPDVSHSTALSSAPASTSGSSPIFQTTASLVSLDPTTTPTMAKAFKSAENVSAHLISDSTKSSDAYSVKSSDVDNSLVPADITNASTKSPTISSGVSTDVDHTSVPADDTIASSKTSTACSGESTVVDRTSVPADNTGASLKSPTTCSGVSTDVDCNSVPPDTSSKISSSKYCTKVTAICASLAPKFETTYHVASSTVKNSSSLVETHDKVEIFSRLIPSVPNPSETPTTAPISTPNLELTFSPTPSTLLIKGSTPMKTRKQCPDTIDLICASFAKLSITEEMSRLVKIYLFNKTYFYIIILKLLT